MGKIDIIPKQGAPRSRRAKISRIFELRRLLKQMQPDLILSFMCPINVIALMASLFLRPPIVVSERSNPFDPPKRKIFAILRKLLYWTADGFVFQTEMARSFFSKRIQKRSAIILNPLMQSLPPAHEGPRDPVIVSAGRLIPGKNHAMMMEAFAQIAERHPEYSLVIYGDNRLENTTRQSLEAKIKELHMQDRIKLPGNVNNLAERMNSTSLFLLASNNEGMPNVLIEAMALGLPCISTDCPCGGPATLIIQEKNGILVPVGDVKTMAAQMDRVLSNPAFAHALGQAAKAVRQDLAPEQIGAQWQSYFQQVLAKAGPRI